MASSAFRGGEQVGLAMLPQLSIMLSHMTVGTATSTNSRLLGQRTSCHDVRLSMIAGQEKGDPPACSQVVRDQTLLGQRAASLHR